MFLRATFFVLSLAAIAQAAPRVIGGHDAPNHKYPHQISLRDKNGHFCSGSILNKRWILSAAHCFDKYQEVELYKIHVGTNFLNESGTIYEPQFLIVHEQYQNFYHYDVAMIRLKSDIVFTDFVKPIALATEDLQDYSKITNFAGWGSTKLWGPSPNVLQEIDLKLLSYEECKKIQYRIDQTHICTLNKNGEGICHGDSGGPLVVDGVQVGITSWVVPCAVNWPDVFTRVFSYKSWIDGNLERFANIWI